MTSDCSQSGSEPAGQHVANAVTSAVVLLQADLKRHRVARGLSRRHLGGTVLPLCMRWRPTGLLGTVKRVTLA